MRSLPRPHLHRHARIALLALITALGTAVAADKPPSIEGEYDCNGCHGFLTVKKKSAQVYRVDWMVGGGSCAGVKIVEGDARYRDDALEIRYKGRKKTCVVRFDVDDGVIDASDSCVTPADEEGSTCAVLGAYVKRGR